MQQYAANMLQYAANESKSQRALLLAVFSMSKYPYFQIFMLSSQSEPATLLLLDTKWTIRTVSDDTKTKACC